MLKKVVKINWGQQFTPSYVRHVFGVVKDYNGYGHVEISNYLPKELFQQDYFYREADLFIVSEFMNANAEKTSHLKPCMYTLVQVDADAEFGYSIINSVRESNSYPSHESKLVSVILKNPELSNVFPSSS